MSARCLRAGQLVCEGPQRDAPQAPQLHPASGSGPVMYLHLRSHGAEAVAGQLVLEGLQRLGQGSTLI